MLTGPRLIVALDFDNQEDCLALVGCLDPTLCRLKIGKESFTRFGPQLVRNLQGLGFDIFLDLKFHDIPNTVAQALKAAADLGVWMVNVHAIGGETMLLAAKGALSAYSKPPLLIAVTVLTSLEDKDLAPLGIAKPVAQQVGDLSQLAFQSGLDGVVCSAREVSSVKERAGSPFLTVTPGIRPASAEHGDQRRVLTPAQAIKLGSDFLVVGRPITQSPTPLAICQQITQEIDDTLKGYA